MRLDISTDYVRWLRRKHPTSNCPHCTLDVSQSLGSQHPTSNGASEVREWFALEKFSRRKKKETDHERDHTDFQKRPIREIREIRGQKLLWWLLLLVVVACHSANALEFQKVEHMGKRFTVCHVDLRTDKLQLFLRGSDGDYYKSFEKIEKDLQPRGLRLLFAMNAGMYQAGFAPVGWCVADGKELSPINLRNAEGNFFLKPNGVFLVTKSGASVVESSRAAASAEQPEIATQSGPLLVFDGKLHPKFNPQSTSALFRNGVGVPEPRTVLFAISEEPVNFYQFATLFRDALHCPNALFLDGTISSLHAPALKRSDKKMDLGPIIGIVGAIPNPQP
jgi:uncharacterized protein YigE (DUF2233 family)